LAVAGEAARGRLLLEASGLTRIGSVPDRDFALSLLSQGNRMRFTKFDQALKPHFELGNDGKCEMSGKTNPPGAA